MANLVVAVFQRLLCQGMYRPAIHRAQRLLPTQRIGNNDQFTDAAGLFEQPLEKLRRHQRHVNREDEV